MDFDEAKNPFKKIKISDSSMRPDIAKSIILSRKQLIKTFKDMLDEENHELKSMLEQAKNQFTKAYEAL